MKKERNDLKAGIFIVISIALIVGIIIGIKGLGQLLEPAQSSTVTFKLTDDLGGLRKGDEVRIGGYKIGVVRDIDIVEQPDGQPQIRVNFTIPKRFVLKHDARVTVQGTLTGTSWLNFDSLGTAAAPVLAAGEPLVGRPSIMGTLMASASELAPELTETVRDVRNETIPLVNETIDSYRTTSLHVTALIKHVRTLIDPIVERYYAIMDTGTDAMGQIRDVFGESKGDFKETVANINAATGTVREKLPGILDQVDGALTKIQTSLDGANAALADIQHIASNTREISDSARSIIVSNRTRIDHMIASLKTMGDNLKFASAEIRRSPWRLLYKPAAGEVSQLNLYDSARQFAEGAGELNDAASALRDALRDPAVSQEQVQALVERLDKTFENFTTIEQQLWQQVR